MPEFPEVFTITRELKKEVEGKTISSVSVLDKALVKPDEKDFAKLAGKKVSEVFQLAKRVGLKIGANTYVLFHLRMTGRLLWRPKGFRKDPYTVLVFAFDKNELRFTEMRRFGYAEIMGAKDFEKAKRDIGPSPFDVSYGDFERLLKSKRTIIKRALLDQKLISGVGNIYANEALWDARIHPQMPTRKISSSGYRNLLDSVKRTLVKAIEYNGSTLKDKSYVDIYGKRGNFQKHFKVYGKGEGERCPRCREKIKIVRISARRTFFCPSCQKLKENILLPNL